MARKFKIGDRVKVIKFTGTEKSSGCFKIGQQGTITDYYPEVPYPYTVKKLRRKQVEYFHARELELVKKV